MIDTEKLRQTVVKGLKKWLGCEVIRTNQTATMPAFPYVAYTITTLADENKGTYGQYADNVKRKPHIQTWSITAHSDKYIEAVKLANKARDWLDEIGTTYLNDNDVIVQSVGSITDRSNLLTAEYQYSYGFDCFFWVYDEIGAENDGMDGVIETADIQMRGD